MNSMNKEIKYCSESHPIRLGDLLFIFSDGHGHIDYDIEICDGDSSVTFEDYPELSGEISNYDDCIVVNAYFEDGCLCMFVKEL